MQSHYCRTLPLVRLLLSKSHFSTPPISVDYNIMALRLLPYSPVSQLLSQFSAPSRSLSFTIGLPSRPSILLSTIFSPAAFGLNVPGILSDLWDSVLRAAPKKKTSHMKKRHRQMAGKALKDVKNLNSCPACGQVKRSHTLCQHCVESMLISLPSNFRPSNRLLPQISRNNGERLNWLEFLPY